MTLSEPQLDISNSFLLQLIISNCIYAFKIGVLPMIQMYSLFQCMLPQTMCSCCGTLHFLELFTYLCTSISFPTKRTLSIPLDSSGSAHRWLERISCKIYRKWAFPNKTTWLVYTVMEAKIYTLIYFIFGLF